MINFLWNTFRTLTSVTGMMNPVPFFTGVTVALSFSWFIGRVFGSPKAGAGGVGTQRQDIAGEDKSLTTQAQEAGAALLQRKGPLEAFNIHLNSFPFHADDMDKQLEVHHYGAKLNEDFTQMLHFDGDGSDARLIGVEYVVSEKLFKQLPEEEKPLWHCHRYEVLSGTMTAPGLPEAAEHSMMKDLVRTYGKVWHTWDIKRNSLVPLGPPKLILVSTDDGQLKPELIKQRDEREHISTEKLRQQRADIGIPERVRGCDVWEKGSVPQISLAQRSVEHMVGGKA